MLRDVHSIKNINELNFDIEDVTYSAVRRELRTYFFCRFESYTVQKF